MIMPKDQPFTVTYDEVLHSAVIDIRGIRSVLPGTFESPEEAGEAAQMFFRALLNRLTAANMNRDILA